MFCLIPLSQVGTTGHLTFEMAIAARQKTTTALAEGLAIPTNPDPTGQINAP